MGEGVQCSGEVGVRAKVCLTLGFLLAACHFGCGAAVAGNSDTPSVDAEALALVARARLRLEEGEVLAGIGLIRKALARDPESDEIREELGLALVQARFADEALRELRRVSALSPEGSAMLGLLLLERAQTLDDLAQAVEPLRAGVAAVPQGPQIRINLVGVLLELGRAQEAWDTLQPALGERVEDPRAWLAAARALRELERYAEAAEYYRKAARIPAFREEAVRGSLESLKAAGEFGAAAQELEDLVDAEQATAAGLVELAILYLRSGDEERGLEFLDQALARDPDHEQALLLRALVATGVGDLETAESMYRRVLERVPGQPMAALGLARVLTVLRELGEARELLEMTWRQVTAAEDPDRDELEEVAQEMANLELIAGKPDDARLWLERISIDPVHRATVFLWTEYFRQKESWRDGLVWLDSLDIEEDPVSRRLVEASRLEFLLAAGEEACAEEGLGILLAGELTDVLAGLNALQQRRMYSRVVDESARALERLDSPVELQFTHAAALERVGRWDDAVAAFRALLAEQEDHHLALNYLGYMFADRNVNLEEALELIQSAVDLEPYRGAYLDSLGWVYFRLGDLDKAERYLTRAVRLEPDSSTIHEHLGDLAAARRKFDRAEEAYRRALDLEPEEEGQEERIREKLAALEHERP